MGNYEVFAKFYDQAMGGRAEERAFIEKLVKQYNSTGKTLLELGCGTGSPLKYFSSKGFEVAGIDISKEMLSMAHSKLPDSKLFQQDMAVFALPEKFDVILCLFDSINHLTKYAKWESLFRRARLHLNKGGLFIFDINTKHQLEVLAEADPIVREFDGKELTMTVTRQGEAYNWNVKIVEKRNNHEEVVGSEDIQEQSFPIQQVKDSLKKLFTEVVAIDRNKEKASEASGRAYFVCIGGSA